MAFAKANLGIASDVNPSKRLFIFARWQKPCHTYFESKAQISSFSIDKVKEPLKTSNSDYDCELELFHGH